MLLLLQLLGRVCPDLLQLLSLSQSQSQQSGGEAEFSSGSLSLEGTMYELDTFPAKAIGPTLWRILEEEEEQQQRNTTAIEIRCHPAIRNEIQQNIKALMLAAATAAKGLPIPAGVGDRLNLTRLEGTADDDN